MAEFKLQETTEGAESGGDRKSFVPIDEDTVLEARVAKVAVEPHKYFKDDQGNPEMKVNFEFHFDFNGKQRKLWGETPTTFTTHPDCKLRNWVQQILGGGDLPAGFTLNTDTLIDQPVRIVIGYREWKDKVSGETKWRNDVKDVMYSKGLASVPAYEEPF